MKIKLIGSDIKLLSKMLESEGDVIVDNGADLILSDTLFTPGTHKCPVVGGNWILPRSVSKTIGFECDPFLAMSIMVSKWFDTGWREQTVLSVPLNTLMRDDLGALAECGIASRYIHAGSLVKLFDNGLFEQILTGLNYCGWVTLSLSLTPESEDPFTMVSVECGFPNFGWLSVLEGARGKISSFFTGEDSLLRESWTSNLLLSKSPYPYNDKVEKYLISGLSSHVLKHFHLFSEVSNYRGKYFTENTRIGIATSWALSLSESSRRTLRPLKGITFGEKQYRDDLCSYVARVYHELETLSLIDP